MVDCWLLSGSSVLVIFNGCLTCVWVFVKSGVNDVWFFENLFVSFVNTCCSVWKCHFAVLNAQLSSMVESRAWSEFWTSWSWWVVKLPNGGSHPMISSQLPQMTSVGDSIPSAQQAACVSLWTTWHVCFMLKTSQLEVTLLSFKTFKVNYLLKTGRPMMILCFIHFELKGFILVSFYLISLCYAYGDKCNLLGFSKEDWVCFLPSV